MCLGPPMHLRQNDLRHWSTANQPLTNVTENSIPNVAEVLHPLLVLRYSRKRHGTKSNAVWFGQDLLRRDSQKIMKPFLSSCLKME